MTKLIRLVRQTADGWHRENIQSEKWDATDNQSKHTPVSAAVFEKVTAAFSVYGDNGPRILSIDSFDRDSHFECEIEIELPGGVILEVDSQSYMRPMPIPETLAEASDEAAELVSLFVSWCARFGFGKLTDKFDDLRSELNKLFEQWSNDGDAHIDLVDLRIKKEPYWQDSVDGPVQITISCLNEYLLGEDMDIEGWYPGEAVAAVRELHAEMKTRTQAKARLERHGADGFIDLIAMNSLLLDGSIKARPEDYLPILREPDLHPDYKVKCGRLYLEATDSSDARLKWHDGYIDIYDLEIPSTLRESLPGKAITALIEHPFLTSEIIIRDIRKMYDGKDYHRIEIEQPCFFYSRGTGRFWTARELDRSHELYG
ncbi:hypothetical protein [Parasphingorhabdus sp.]|uniref:hypothetical protein n=1 Tax=Parasphingorhabdus sp. TaxID=2709688 RepID=UPI003001ABB7